jgi:hypothetical protein
MTTCPRCDGDRIIAYYDISIRWWRDVPCPLCTEKTGHPVAEMPRQVPPTTQPTQLTPDDPDGSTPDNELTPKT